MTRKVTSNRTAKSIAPPLAETAEHWHIALNQRGRALFCKGRRALTECVRTGANVLDIKVFVSRHHGPQNSGVFVDQRHGRFLPSQPSQPNSQGPTLPCR